MKSIGMARKIDHLGRIVLPSELRRLHGIQEGDYLEISVEGDRIVLHKLEKRCVFCSSATELWSYRSKLVCPRCATEVTLGSAPTSTEVPVEVAPPVLSEIVDQPG